MSPEERELVLQQSLANEDNVRIALLIGTTFEELRFRIIRGFADSLSNRLRERFGPAWRVRNGIGVDGYLQKSESLWASRHFGIERVTVSLRYDKSPERMYYAVLKEEPRSSSTINWVRVKHELDRRFAVGQANETCHWMSYVDHAYRNWYDVEILPKLWKKAEAVIYFSNRLSAIMGIIASVLQAS
jgi:hypothetical protein